MDWKAFLNNDTNKQQFIKLLTRLWSQDSYAPKLQGRKVVIINDGSANLLTYHDGVKTVHTDIDELKSTQEETDSRMILYCEYGRSERYRYLRIKIPDTDVFFILLHYALRMENTTILFYTGIGNKKRLINVSEMAQEYGQEYCSSLLGMHAFSGCDSTNWGWRHREPFDLPYHEPALVTEWQGHTCSFLLGTKPLWHWWKLKSGPTSKRGPRPRYRPTSKCPLYRYETTGQLLHSEVGSNQVGCSCTWQRSLSCETNTRATEEVPVSNQSWRGCNHPTSNWPYQGHQIPYLVLGANWLSPLWSNTDHRLYAASVCIVTGMSWWILHSRLFEYSLRDNSWDLHSRVPAGSGILLSNMM